MARETNPGARNAASLKQARMSSSPPEEQYARLDSRRHSVGAATPIAKRPAARSPAPLGPAGNYYEAADAIGNAGSVGQYEIAGVGRAQSTTYATANYGEICT